MNIQGKSGCRAYGLGSVSAFADRTEVHFRYSGFIGNVMSHTIASLPIFRNRERSEVNVRSAHR